MSFPFDSISLVETNKQYVNSESGIVAALTFLTVFNLGVSVYCLANPKTCYGSCPTFYMSEWDNFHYSDAEGFSNAILPSMEYADIDALSNTFHTNNSFTLNLRNVALETHCIRSIKLLAVPRNKGQRIYHSPNDKFYLCNSTVPLSQATALEGDITKSFLSPDIIERFSLSDENNISSKEDIILEFSNSNSYKKLGLNLHFRQTMMSTYLFYSAMGYMGNEVSDCFAKLNSDPNSRMKFDGIINSLGGIEVYLWDRDNNKWVIQETLSETGPIAVNKQFVPLKNINNQRTIKIKLKLNKGLWRLDYAALSEIIQEVTPINILPSRITTKGKTNNECLVLLNNPDKYLITMPGDDYLLTFNLPDKNADYELFLYSKGYYLEWMRPQWMADKNILKLKLLVDNPELYLKQEPKNYKRFEKYMEQEFWNSKIDTKKMWAQNEN